MSAALPLSYPTEVEAGIEPAANGLDVVSRAFVAPKVGDD